MSFYNGILNHDDNHESSQGGQRGLPGIGYKLTSDGDYDIQNKKLTNVKLGDADNDVMVKKQIENYISTKTIYLKDVNPGQIVNNKAVIYSNTGSIHTNSLYTKDRYGQEVIFHTDDQDDNQIRLYIPNLKNNDSFAGRLKSDIMVTSIKQTIQGPKIFHDIQVPTPTIDGHASNKAYVDNEMSKISDASDNSNYVKKSGDTMSGDFNMTNNIVTNVKSPINDNDVANKSYIDNQLIQSAHPQTNILKYIMDDIDQTSSEYGIEIDKIDNYDESFHSYNKKVFYLKLLKDVNNYRARIGYNIYQLIDKNKNKYYTAVIEWLTTDNNAWIKMEIFNNITSGSIISNQTRKFEDGKGLYYTRSIVQFEVMSISSAPLYLLSTIHIDGVNPTYPAKFSEMYNIIYGIDGNHSAILSEVYDTHKAFEIEKTKMKMLVDLDMNNKLITNIGSLNMNNNNIKNIGNISNNNIISIYGIVNEYKYFTSENAIIEFGNIKIKYIRLYNQPKLSNKSDTVHIYITNNEERFDFQYKNIGWYTHIIINRFYNVVSSIKLKNNTNVTFQLGYELFY